MAERITTNEQLLKIVPADKLMRNNAFSIDINEVVESGKSNTFHPVIENLKDEKALILSYLPDKKLKKPYHEIIGEGVWFLV